MKRAQSGQIRQQSNRHVIIPRDERHLGTASKLNHRSVTGGCNLFDRGPNNQDCRTIRQRILRWIHVYYRNIVHVHMVCLPKTNRKIHCVRYEIANKLFTLKIPQNIYTFLEHSNTNADYLYRDYLAIRSFVVLFATFKLQVQVLREPLFFSKSIGLLHLIFRDALFDTVYIPVWRNIIV